MNEQRSVALVSQARRELAEAKTINEAKTIMDKAELARVLARKAQLGLEAQNEAAEVKIRAERLAGQLIKDGQASGEIASQSTGRPSKSDTVSDLSSLGISHKQSSRWQQQAAIPEPEFEAFVEETKADGEELTSAGVRRIAKAMQFREEAPDLFEAVSNGKLSIGYARRKLGARQAKDRNDTGLGKQTLKNRPLLMVGDAMNLDLPDESVDIIITSPPYNLGSDNWPMGGHGRVHREKGIGYSDQLEDAEYIAWQLSVFNELYRVAKPGASLFYNHKTRTKDGVLLHPIAWLCQVDGWVLRQEIIWDRVVTHNHSSSLFWPVDERIYWFTKGKPQLERPIGKPTIFRHHGPAPHTDHPAPFTEALPRYCLEAVGQPGMVVLDPFVGSGTTVDVAVELGFTAIGIDIDQRYIDNIRNRYE